VQPLQHGKRSVILHDRLNEPGKWRRSKAAMGQAMFGEPRRHIKSPVLEAVVIHAAILVDLTRVKEDHASWGHVIGTAGMLQTLHTANH
jgi:hypothetical protein